MVSQRLVGKSGHEAPIPWQISFVSIVLTSVFLLGTAVHVHAQSPTSRLPVYVALSADDSVGERLAYDVREELRRSAGFTLSVREGATLQIELVSLDLASAGETKGIHSAVSVAFTMTNYLPFEREIRRLGIRSF